MRDSSPHHSFKGPSTKPCIARLEGCTVERVPGFSYCQRCRNALTKSRKLAKKQWKQPSTEKARAGSKGA